MNQTHIHWVKPTKHWSS